ncbi:MAG: oligosaccharide flippase family protein [Micromonosporaceae bacterium]|nr:oligosaccharide flippase family protein [Micromonosporaceae bacterium]
MPSATTDLTGTPGPARAIGRMRVRAIGRATVPQPTWPAPVSPVPVPPPPAPPSDPPPGRLRSAVFWSYALTAGRVGTTTVVLFVLARMLGPAAFGVVAIGVLVLNLAQVLLQQGMISAIVQRDQLTDDHLDAAFVAMLLAGLVAGAAMAASGPLWALLAGEPQLTTVCLALSPLVPVHALMVVPEAVLRRALQFRAIAVRTLAGALAGGAAGIALAVAGAGLWALVAQQLVTGLASVIVLWVVCPWRPSRRPRIRAIRDLWRFSAHSANAGIALTLSTRADQFVTGLLFGPVTMGVYRLAVRLPEMLVEVTARSLQQVALPALSRLQDDRAAFARRLVELQHLAAVAGLPLLGVLAGTAEPLVGLLGPEWAGTELPLQLLCIFAAANVYGVLLGPALQAIGHPGRLAALAWLRGLIGVAMFIAIGIAMLDQGPGTQAAAIALAAVIVQVVLNAVGIQLTRYTVRGTRLRLIGPTIPAVLAAIAAAAAPLGLARIDAVPATPLTALLVQGAAGALAGGAVLWAADRRLRELVRRRGRRPATEPPSADGSPPRHRRSRPT